MYGPLDQSANLERRERHRAQNVPVPIGRSRSVQNVTVRRTTIVDSATNRSFTRVGMGYKPCLQFSDRYRKETVPIMEDRRKFLMVIVNDGLNQQRNQIVGYIIVRILSAALAIPIMRENLVWEDDSEFNDIFDYDHFKKTLADDVRVVATLP
ncbi:Peptide-O-fucosyltransferase [Zostera marina]|uniref:O-fucosyltransferase family protein n=1 Tax=Zostera marina TaxID=29655 RepID=A0A0K9PWP3_ZOSMR|nr:Peptide-O-fucosyltransferase [Zostera marina]